MTKILLKILLFLMFIQQCKAQKEINYLETIQNSEQITDLLHSIDERYKKFKIKDSLNFKDRYNDTDYKITADSLNIKPWVKTDFDNNGLTDLLVIGDFYDDLFVLSILNKNGTYEINNISNQQYNRFIYPVVENNKIRLYFENVSELKVRRQPVKLNNKLLTYKYGGFVEENSNPSNQSIKKIEYTTTGCFGTCPVFELIIHSNKKANWIANRFNKIEGKLVNGNYTAVIKEEDFNKIINLLNYIDFETLEEHYAVNWTDDQSCVLKITYDDGKIKTIHDYGLLGTYGLSHLYDVLFDLRKNQNWTK